MTNNNTEEFERIDTDTRDTIVFLLEEFINPSELTHRERTRYQDALGELTTEVETKGESQIVNYGPSYLEAGEPRTVREYLDRLEGIDAASKPPSSSHSIRRSSSTSSRYSRFLTLTRWTAISRASCGNEQRS